MTSPMPVPIVSTDGERARSGRFDRRKEEILNAAGGLFNRHGLRDATLAVIAAETGLNLKSLRYYFQKREDLVAACFMRSIALHAALARDAARQVGVEARVRAFVAGYFDLRASVQRGERPQFVHFGDVRALTAPHSDVVWPAYAEMFRTICDLFRTGEFAWTQARLKASTHMLLSQLLWSVVWADDYFPEDAPLLACRTCDILLHGLAARINGWREVRHVMPSMEPEGDRLSPRAFLRTATVLINRLGYRGASVDRISGELGVTKGAFYHHNDTRDGLVVACFEQTFARLRAAQDAALASGGDGLSCVADAAVGLVRRQMCDEGTLLRTSALTAVGPELRRRMASEMFRLTLRFADMLNDGMADGSVRLCNVRVAAEMVTATINSAEELRRWVPTATAGNAAELTVFLLLDGLLPRPGAG